MIYLLYDFFNLCETYLKIKISKINYLRLCKNAKYSLFVIIFVKRMNEIDGVVQKLYLKQI